MGGWIKLYRELLDKAIWQLSTPEQKVILITLLTMVNHKASEWEWQGKRFTVQPGQMVTSLDSIKEACGPGVSVQNIRTALKRFKNYEFLTDQPTKTGRLITIVNWALYQNEDTNPNKATNKDLTKCQQSTNKDLTPNKNDKNVKKNKNDKKEPVARYSTKQKNITKSMAESVQPKPAPAESNILDQEYRTIATAFEQNGFGTVSGFIHEDLVHELDDLHQLNADNPAELIIKALRESVEGGKRSWKYATAILHRWEDHNLLTVADVDADKQKYKADRQQSQEPVPESYAYDLPF